MTNSSLLSKARSIFLRKNNMKSPSLPSKTSAQEQEVSVQATADAALTGLSAVNAIPQLAISALAIANATDTILRSAGSSFGLADLAILNALASQPMPRPMGRLIVSLGVTRQRVQKQIDDLQKAGLVNVEDSADDKRVKNVSLTDAGSAALLATSGLLTDQLSKSELFSEIKALDVLQRRLGRLATSLGRMMRAELQVIGAAKKTAKLGSSAPE
jgi:DNA-binding MarR family transcriptional regulator